MQTSDAELVWRITDELMAADCWRFLLEGCFCLFSDQAQGSVKRLETVWIATEAIEITPDLNGLGSQLPKSWSEASLGEDFLFHLFNCSH